MSRKSILVSLSGGMDSATLLAHAKQQGDVKLAVSFRYGSKHNPYENEAADRIADHYEVPLMRFDLSHIFQEFSSNLLRGQGPIPEGHYEAASMSQTVVPARNIIFASVLAGLAWSNEMDQVWLGVHAGDHAIYPDCRPEFISAMQTAICAGTGSRVHLAAPFLFLNKTKIIQRGVELDVPYEMTRTCYQAQEVACGKCGSCQERLEAFFNNGIEDPIAYESRTIFPKPGQD